MAELCSPNRGEKVSVHSKGRCLLTILSLIFIVTSVSAATTQVEIVKYANDGKTVISQRTVSYQWMMNNLPVLGDGVTHYYHQGPVFKDDPDPVVQEQLRWNPEEDSNILDKDMGAVKGTNVKDLCDLVGGMAPGEQAKILSSDGFSKWFAYENVYGYSSREGPIGLTWYMNGNYPDSGYSDGMRLVWFADDSVNTLGPGGTGIHAFGNWDWHEAAASKYWYYYVQGVENYPTTTGLSAKYVNRIYIYSDDPVPVVLPLPGQTSVPTDPDKDGLYEDMNGNGAIGFGDVVLFFTHIEWIKEKEPVIAFDFSGNGVIGFQDVVVFFNQVG